MPNLKIAISIRKTKNSAKFITVKEQSPYRAGIFSLFPDIPEDSNYDPLERWSQEKNRLYLRYKHMKLWWDMPLDFPGKTQDLFKLKICVVITI